MVTYFISAIVDLIEEFFLASGFSSSILLAPFIFWVIRQVIVMFKAIVWSLFK